MNTYTDDHYAIKEIVNLYFKGTYEGNADLIKKAFHPGAHITGILQGQYYDWTLTDFIERVTQTPTPALKKEPYNKEIINIDFQNEAAMVKARVAVGDYIFTDYITLLKIDGRWIIRNKSFTNSP
jgi:hypothetical protein